MKQKMRALLPYGAALAVNFYGLPLLVRNTGAAMLVMLAVIPIVTFLCAAIYGSRKGFGFLFPIMTAVLFAPSILLFYNASAAVYIAIYAVIALAGNGIGSLTGKKDKKKGT